MVGLITNQNGTGTFAEVLDIPRNCSSIQVKCRTSNDMEIRFRGQTTYYTITSGNSLTLTGEFMPGDFSINLANGLVAEIIMLTNGVSV